MGTPRDVSVIVASYNSGSTIASCLESLLDQRFAGEYEIVVADSSEDDTAELVARRFPGVRLLRLPTGTHPGGARNAGVAHAIGRVVAFTDADCVVPRDWVARIMVAHDTGNRVVGGGLRNANPQSYVGWAYYLSAFARWMPGTPPGPIADLPTGCLAVDRSLLVECGGFPERGYSSDTAFSLRARRRGHTLAFDVGIEVSHRNIDRLGTFIRNRLVRGWAFACMRVEEEEFTTVRAVVFAVLAPFLPPLLSFRVARLVFARRRHRREFLLASPLVFVGFVLWSVGEAAGYGKHAARRFVR
jgi:GT2 family glycosyltransferase